MPAEPPVILYDGNCALCSRAVRVTLRADRRRILQFAALNGVAAVRLLEGASAEVRNADSLVWIEPASPGQTADSGRPARTLVRSDAAIALGSYLGGGWELLALTANIFPRKLRDTVYDFIAQHRFRWFGKADPSCELPPAHERHRFLDLSH